MLELIVTGWGGVGAPAAKVRLREFCEGCEHASYAIGEPSRLIDESAWDGSDLFFVWPLPRFRFITDRLANIVNRECITGTKLISAQEIPIKRGMTQARASLNIGYLTNTLESSGNNSAFNRFEA
jgi:hypothetical protein